MPQWNRALLTFISGGKWSLAPCTATWRSTTTRVPPRLSRLCVTSESWSDRADQCASCLNTQTRVISVRLWWLWVRRAWTRWKRWALPQLPLWSRSIAKDNNDAQGERWMCQLKWHRCEVKLTLSGGAHFFRLYPDGHLLRWWDGGKPMGDTSSPIWHWISFGPKQGVLVNAKRHTCCGVRERGLRVVNVYVNHCTVAP